MSRADPSSDDGFTLVELLAAMLVMLVITVPLVTSFVVGLTTTRDGLQDTTNSADAQVLAAFFDIDVAGSQQVLEDVESSCGGAAVLELSWDDAGTANVVTYRLAAADPAIQQDVHEVDPSATVATLERAHCVGSAEPVVNAVARSVVGTPSVTCDGDLDCPVTPRTVSLELQQYSALVKDRNATSNRYTTGVTGTRKVTTQ